MLEKSGFDGLGVVVTGAAAGIGAATAEVLGGLGAHVLAVDLDADGLTELAGRLAGSGAGCTVVEADLTERSDVERVSRAVEESGVVVKALVNNVGANSRRSILDLDPEQWDRDLARNLTSAYLLTRALLPALLAAPRGGSVVNVSSTHALAANAAALGYATTKSGLLGFTRQLAAEYADRGLRVNAVCPGLTMTRRIADRGVTEPQERMRDRLLGRRFAAPEEVANGIAFLASDAASYITGVTLPIDGGFTAR
ncbi:SDR family NAD(P)-dependent oxidoreductase [Streptomyces griseoflavus]|uniref:SDR family NAD(P)-dependent oxidoreductase n=1 Tax=Streptomyces griseoflavus TaxID=35619 RepID=UPI00167CBAEE|nr:SDR family oxidoreductase [Streptomyces griseoflavus]GGV13423.1 2-deoxy-D-gluconate 3-dehydrogenase [Streptomyces griseoflavus]